MLKYNINLLLIFIINLNISIIFGEVCIDKYFRTDLKHNDMKGICSTFAEYKNSTCCCEGSINYKDFCINLEKEDEFKECPKNIIDKFIVGFFNNQNLCDFCKNDIKSLQIESLSCYIEAKKSNSKYFTEMNDLYSFLTDFVKSGSCESVCECIDPKPTKCPIFGDCCEDCVCISSNASTHNVYHEGDTYPNKGCNWNQFGLDWIKQTTTKCTTKKFN